MSRRRTPGQRFGLFEFVDTSAGAIQPAEVRPNPLLKPCRFCGAGIGQHCTRVSRHGLIPTAPHSCRVEDAERDAAADQEPTDLPPSSPVGARTDRP